MTGRPGQTAIALFLSLCSADLMFPFQHPRLPVQAAKAATSSLFERQLATQRPFAGGADGEEAVQQAVQGVLDSGLH